IAHSRGAVQLHHRLLAYLLVAVASGLAFNARRSSYLAPESKSLALATSSAVGVQALLGILTLMAGTPLWLGMLHQLVAAVLLALATAFAWRVRRI
ncbi:MAG: COX15/CtaA family protein, partial [Caulobacteraceae bacterium]|nr:COX15/CtaA family protein [Caulobacteraceae bacterium]